MAPIEHSYFPQWSHLDSSRSIRRTLTVAVVATAVGMTAGASAIAFLITSPVVDPNLPSSSTEITTTSFGTDQRVAVQPSQVAPKPAIDRAEPIAVDGAQPKSSADRQQASAIEPRGTAAVVSSDNEVHEPKTRVEQAKRDRRHSVAHTRKNYRTRFSNFFSPFPSRNRRWVSARARYPSNLSPL